MTWQTTTLLSRLLGYWFYFFFFSIICIFPITLHSVCRLRKINMQTITPHNSESNTIQTQFHATSAILYHFPNFQLAYLLPGAPTCMDPLHHSWMTRIVPEIQNQFCHLLLVSGISSLLFWPSGLDLKETTPSYQTWQVVTKYLSHETCMEYSSSFSASLFPWWQVYPQHVLFRTQMWFRESQTTWNALCYLSK